MSSSCFQSPVTKRDTARSAARQLLLGASAAACNQIAASAFLSGSALLRSTPDGRSIHRPPSNYPQVSGQGGQFSVEGAARQRAAGVRHHGTSMEPTALLGCLAIMHRCNVSRRSRAHARTAVIAAAQTDAGMITDTAELEALQRQAARLRNEVEELKAAQYEQQLVEQKKWFKIFDADGSGTVDAAEIQRGMAEFNGYQIDKEQSIRLLKVYDKNQDNVLQLEEFDVQSFAATIDQLMAEARAKEAAERRQELAKQEQLEYERALEEYRTTLPGENQSTDVLTRLAAVLPYILPITDGVRYGMPLAAMFPVLQPLFQLLLIPTQVLNSIPLAYFFLFFGMQYLAGRENLPALLRFNLMQAISLDILLIVPNILAAAGNFFLKGQIPQEVVVVLATLVFLPFAASMIYCIGSTLLGIAPRSIPNTSENVEQQMGLRPPTPPGRKETDKDDGNLPA